MFASLIAAAALQGAGGLPLPDFCIHPTSRTDRIICADPELLMRSKVSIRLYADVRATDKVQADIAEEGQNWPYVLDKCADRACLLREYEERISRLATPFETPDFRIRGAQRLKRRDPPSTHIDQGQFELLPLGEGWMFFRLSAFYEKNPALEPFMGGQIGFFKLDGEQGRFRDTDKSGLDFQREAKGGWRVIQIGDCPCGAHISLDGLYR